MAEYCVTGGRIVIPIASMAGYCVIQGCIVIPNVHRASQLSSSLTLSRDNGCYTLQAPSRSSPIQNAIKFCCPLSSTRSLEADLAWRRSITWGQICPTFRGIYSFASSLRVNLDHNQQQQFTRLQVLLSTLRPSLRRYVSTITARRALCH